MELEENDYENVHIIASHPKGNGTFNYRIKSFKTELEFNRYKVTIPYITYPFETYFQGIFKEIDIIDKSSLLQVKPHLNWIQKTIFFFQKFNTSPLFFKILYAINIVLYKIDIWYVPLYRSYRVRGAKNIIIATGGPGSVFRMAYELSQRSESKLILDYRDPWNLGYNLLETGIMVSKLKRKIMLNGEMHILKNADHIITVSESLRSFFPNEFQHKITVIENGSNFEQEEIVTKINCKPSHFNIVYLGTIYDDQLFEEDFFIAFAEFYKNSKAKERISLKFIGSDKSLKLKKILKKYELDEISEITVRVDNETLIQYLLNASIFLHLRFKGRSKIISSKNSDYLMFRKPILLPVSDKGDIADSITHYNAGYVCNGVKETLKSLEEEYGKHLTGQSIILDKNDFSWLSRKELAKKLTKIISSLDSLNPPSL